MELDCAAGAATEAAAEAAASEVKDDAAVRPAASLAETDRLSVSSGFFPRGVAADHWSLAGWRSILLLPARSATEGHTIRGDQGSLMLRKRVAPHSEVIRVIVLEDSPCCGGPAPVSPSKIPSNSSNSMKPDVQVKDH